MRREGPRVFFSLLNAVAGFDIFFFGFRILWSFFFSRSVVLFRYVSSSGKRNGAWGLMHENKYPRWEILSRLEKRTCLSSTCYRPSMVSNAFPDQSFSPCHHREIICSYIRTPTAPAVPRRYSFYAGCPSLPSTVGFSTTPFSDCTDSATEAPLQRPTHTLPVNGRGGDVRETCVAAASGMRALS